eukprot:scaffold22839_cov171-Amphora_coffeaeformis.AAC.10
MDTVARTSTLQQDPNNSMEDFLEKVDTKMQEGAWDGSARDRVDSIILRLLTLVRLYVPLVS